MNEKCKGRFGAIRCRFEARYEAGATTPEQIAAITHLGIYHDDELVNAISEAADRRYIGDVCTACGEYACPPKGS